MQATPNVTIRALRDLALLAGAGLAAASIWAAGAPPQGYAADAEAAQQAGWMPRLGEEYQRSLGGTRYTLRVEEAAKGMQYTIAYGGQVYSYLLGPFDAISTVVRAVADVDDDGLPDFLVQVDGAGYVLLSTQALPGANLPAAELVADDDEGGC